MTPTPIRVNREALSTAVAALALADGPLRLSAAFLRIWCGQEQPTEQLAGWLAERGLEIVPGLDAHAGWEVRRASEGNGGLF